MWDDEVRPTTKAGRPLESASNQRQGRRSGATPKRAPILTRNFCWETKFFGHSPGSSQTLRYSQEHGPETHSSLHVRHTLNIKEKNSGGVAHRERRRGRNFPSPTTGKPDVPPAQPLMAPGCRTKWAKTPDTVAYRRLESQFVNANLILSIFASLK